MPLASVVRLQLLVASSLSLPLLVTVTARHVTRSDSGTPIAVNVTDGRNGSAVGHFLARNASSATTAVSSGNATPRVSPPVNSSGKASAKATQVPSQPAVPEKEAESLPMATLVFGRVVKEDEIKKAKSVAAKSPQTSNATQAPAKNVSNAATRPKLATPAKAAEKPLLRVAPTAATKSSNQSSLRPSQADHDNAIKKKNNKTMAALESSQKHAIAKVATVSAATGPVEDAELARLRAKLKHLEGEVAAAADSRAAEVVRQNQLKQARAHIGEAERKLQEIGQRQTPPKIEIDTKIVPRPGAVAPFGREGVASELTNSSVAASNGMIDQIERAQSMEGKRAVYRALTKLRGATINSYDGIARSHLKNVDEYAKTHKWRDEHPVKHLAQEESDTAVWAFPSHNKTQPPAAKPASPEQLKAAAPAAAPAAAVTTQSPPAAEQEVPPSLVPLPLEHAPPGAPAVKPKAASTPQLTNATQQTASASGNASTAAATDGAVSVDPKVNAEHNGGPRGSAGSAMVVVSVFMGATMVAW